MYLDFMSSILNDKNFNPSETCSVYVSGFDTFILAKPISS